MTYSPEQIKEIELLIRLLKKAGVPKGEASSISFQLRAPGKAGEMIEWLLKNPAATRREIWTKMEEMAGLLPRSSSTI